MCWSVWEFILTFLKLQIGQIRNWSLRWVWVCDDCIYWEFVGQILCRQLIRWCLAFYAGNLWIMPQPACNVKANLNQKSRRLQCLLVVVVEREGWSMPTTTRKRRHSLMSLRFYPQPACNPNQPQTQKSIRPQSSLEDDKYRRSRHYLLLEKTK